jgi:virginiamycin B lyase
MELKEITLPNAGTRPRRIAIDSQDRIWISDYSRGYLGLYDTKTGKTAEWPSPGGPRSQPYGITTLNDVVWYDEGNTKPNALVRFDPKTEKFQTFPIPSGGGVVRNMMPTKDGKGLVLAESGVNRVAIVSIQN